MKMVEEKKEIIEVEVEQLPTDALAPWEKRIKLVRELVAKGSTPEEFQLLVHLSREYGLDPLKREVYCVRYGNNPTQIFISRDGALSIAHRSGDFEAMETTVEFEKKPENPKITYVDRIKKPYSATCTIYKKGSSRPFRETVYFSEYNLGQALWLKKPCTMLKKVAESQCLRKAFNIHGVFDQSEFPETETIKIEQNGN